VIANQTRRIFSLYFGRYGHWRPPDDRNDLAASCSIRSRRVGQWWKAVPARQAFTRGCKVRTAFATARHSD
jgi:hypothetical protein